MNRLPGDRFKSVPGLGSRRGGESLAIIDRIEELTSIGPSQKLRSHLLGGLQSRYVDTSRTRPSNSPTRRSTWCSA
jgi:hypothetical protein